MTKEKIELINSSWQTLAAHPGAMLSFYDRLFVIAPQVRHYFSDDLTKQSEKLAYTIGFVVGNLERMDEIKSAVEDLGRFHNRMKIKPEYYGMVKQALLETIANILADKHTQEINQAWDEALTAIATIMINAPEKREPTGFKKLISKLFGTT